MWPRAPNATLKPVCGIYRTADSEGAGLSKTKNPTMTTYEASHPARPGQRWAIWAALVLGLMFLGLGAPLMAQHGEVAERAVDARPNG